MRKAAVLLVALVAAGRALAQQPTPAGERVVVPSLPDQKNKEGVVQPSGGMKTDSEGYVKNDARPIDPQKAPAETGGAGGAPGQPVPGPGIGAMAAPAPGPGGPAVVNAAYLTIRGVVKSFEKNVSVTVTEANGKVRSVPLAEKAAVYEGLAAGDKVAVRIPLQQPADGKHADRVEKQKPPKAAPKSKFAQAQSPRS